jgi:hypothetical protein
MLDGSDETRTEIIRLCGLSSLLGPGMLRRALKDAGVEGRSPTLEDYRNALPRLELRLATYLDPARASEVVRSIREFLNGQMGKPTTDGRNA